MLNVRRSCCTTWNNDLQSPDSQVVPKDQDLNKSVHQSNSVPLIVQHSMYLIFCAVIHWSNQTFGTNGRAGNVDVRIFDLVEHKYVPLHHVVAGAWLNRR